MHSTPASSGPSCASPKAAPPTSATSSPLSLGSSTPSSYSWYENQAVKANVPTSPGSPIRTVQTGRVLRRKRSSANAALTSRPSLVSLRSRGDCMPGTSATGSNIVPSLLLLESAGSMLDLGGAAAATEADLSMQPESALSDRLAFDYSKPKCILIHTMTTAAPSSHSPSTHLVYALFEPNSLVDASGSVSAIIDREKWERLRATVEESRIIAMHARVGEPVGDGGADPVGERGQECSGQRCWAYNLSAPAAPACESTFYIQASPPSQSSPQAKTSQLMTLSVRAADQSRLEDSAKWPCLPSQVRALLEQSQAVQAEAAIVPSPYGSQLVDHLLRLVR